MEKKKHKGKKFTLSCAMTAQWGSRGIALITLSPDGMGGD
jgi:hypothetical protein